MKGVALSRYRYLYMLGEERKDEGCRIAFFQQVAPRRLLCCRGGWRYGELDL